MSEPMQTNKRYRYRYQTAITHSVDGNVQSNTDSGHTTNNSVPSTPPPLQTITNSVNNRALENKPVRQQTAAPPTKPMSKAITADMVGGLFVTVKPITVTGAVYDSVPVGTPGRIVYSQRSQNSVVAIFGAPYDDIEATISVDQCTFGMTLHLCISMSSKHCLCRKYKTDDNPKFSLYII